MLRRGSLYENSERTGKPSPTQWPAGADFRATTFFIA